MYQDVQFGAAAPAKPAAKPQPQVSAGSLFTQKLGESLLRVGETVATSKLAPKPKAPAPVTNITNITEGKSSKGIDKKYFIIGGIVLVAVLGIFIANRGARAKVS